MKEMEKLIVANWKMNPDSEGRAVRLARLIDRVVPRRGVEVVIAPPFPFLSAVHKILKRSYLGAQDVFWETKGARTGEVSGHQLKHLKVEYVIVGHSERRALGETDTVVNKKLKAALDGGLKAILCVGESWNIRKEGLNAAKNFVGKQLKNDLKGTSKLMKLKANKLIIAYEPVWAIGTGRADKPSDTVEMAKFIKDFLKTKNYKLKTKVLYGGSVNSKNIREFLGRGGVSGALVGGASLRAEEFKKIIKIVS